MQLSCRRLHDGPVKRIWVIIAFILVLTVGGAGIAAYLSGSDEEQPTAADPATSPLTVPASPEPVVWDGRGIQEINTTFMVGNHQIIVERFIYGGLKGERANVGVDVVVITPAAKPAWIKNAWVMNSATNRWQPASMKVRTTGKRHRITLRFAKLPVKRLRGSMAFSVTYPDGEGRQSFSIAPLAPSAPASALVAEPDSAPESPPAN